MLFNDASTIPMVGKLAITGTALFTSVSSTILLELITHPYVTKMIEITKDGDETRSFQAFRLNILGSERDSVIKLSDIEHITTSIHPYASFRANGKFYYIQSPLIKDQEVKFKMFGKLK